MAHGLAPEAQGEDGDGGIGDLREEPARSGRGFFEQAGRDV
jgi:hypothetical protein